MSIFDSLRLTLSGALGPAIEARGVASSNGSKPQTQSVAVIGLGYVGLPLAVLAQEKGWSVTGVDIDAEKVAKINRGVCPIKDDRLAKDLVRHPIAATTDPAAVAASAVIVIAVPTPVTEENLPDLQPLLAAIAAIRPYLAPGQVVIVESTINPGVMNEAVVPELKKRADLALDADGRADGIFLAHCPERINPGDPKWTVRNIPRVLGGYSAEGTARARQFYESVLDAPVTVMASVTEAEAVKILENTFRDVNIAFVNEMARSFAALGIDVTHVIAGASTKPFAFMPHYPGNGVGGHCISVDPYYMIERGRQAGFEHEFLTLARQINNDMPAYAVELLINGLKNRGIDPAQATVAVLGVSYKRDIDDVRNSPALDIIRLMQDRQLSFRVFDPYVPGQSTVASLDAALTGCQAVMVATDHAAFVSQLTGNYLAQKGITVIVDGKNALDADAIAASGIHYYGIGRSRLPQTG